MFAFFRRLQRRRRKKKSCVPKVFTLLQHLNYAKHSAYLVKKKKNTHAAKSVPYEENPKRYPLAI
jgi:hypothetical protein